MTSGARGAECLGDGPRGVIVLYLVLFHLQLHEVGHDLRTQALRALALQSVNRDTRQSSDIHQETAHNLRTQARRALALQSVDRDQKQRPSHSDGEGSHRDIENKTSGT